MVRVDDASEIRARPERVPPVTEKGNKDRTGVRQSTRDWGNSTKSDLVEGINNLRPSVCGQSKRSELDPKGPRQGLRR